jgi:hypothetical protein
MAIFTPTLSPATATNGDDFLIGSQAGEAISGLVGDDQILGLDGDDRLRSPVMMSTSDGMPG